MTEKGCCRHDLVDGLVVMLASGPSSSCITFKLSDMAWPSSSPLCRLLVVVTSLVPPSPEGEPSPSPSPRENATGVCCIFPFSCFQLFACLLQLSLDIATLTLFLALYFSLSYCLLCFDCCNIHKIPSRAIVVVPAYTT